MVSAQPSAVTLNLASRSLAVAGHVPLPSHGGPARRFTLMPWTSRPGAPDFKPPTGCACGAAVRSAWSCSLLLPVRPAGRRPGLT
jgi:hypothetical protein